MLRADSVNSSTLMEYQEPSDLNNGRITLSKSNPTEEALISDLLLLSTQDGGNSSEKMVPSSSTREEK
jgi:hypothetical protein